MEDHKKIGVPLSRRTVLQGAASGVALVSISPFFGTQVFAQDGSVMPDLDLPREQTLIMNCIDGVVRNPGWFNVWVNAGGSIMNGLHQLCTDCLWYVDPDAGIDGAVYNSLASGPAEYNADFTEMTVKLRPGLLWSDGEEFDAGDVVYTVQKQIETPGMLWSGAFSAAVDSVEAVDKYTVHFKLKAPNSRFHATFSVRFNAAWIMPEHIFSKVEDVMSYDFNPPVSLGPYTLHSFDPNGTWYIWEKRKDWDKTSIAVTGEPVPQYALYRGNIPIDNRVIELASGRLDMIIDLTPEAMFSIVKQNKFAKGWFDTYPYGHPDPTLPMIIFNHQNAKFQDKRVRWALALMLDGKTISMGAFRGATTLSAISIPPTGTHPQDYHAPMQQWLTGYELDTGTRKIKPYDPTVGLQVAELVRAQFPDAVPTEEDAIRKAFGYGWWKQDLEAAGELLAAAGFTKNGNQWMMPSGEPFAFTLTVPPEGVMNRLGVVAAQLWSQAGVTVTPEVATDSWDRQAAGNYEANIAWAVETWGGHPDLSFFLDSYHSQYLAEPGAVQPARNWMRWKNADLDALIEKLRRVDFNDPQVLDLGREFVKLHIDEMPNIPITAYNFFSVVSHQYWTGWPNANNPYGTIVNGWANTKFTLIGIKPVTA